MLRRDDADARQQRDDQRRLERDADPEDHPGDETNVAADAKVARYAAEAGQKGNRYRQHDEIGECGAGDKGEEDKRQRDVQRPLLVRQEAGHHKCHQLVDDDRHRQHSAYQHGHPHVHPDGFGQLDGLQVLQSSDRLGKHAEDRFGKSEPNHHSHRDGGQNDEQPAAQLHQVRSQAGHQRLQIGAPVVRHRSAPQCRRSPPLM